jgi:hypothetical protein
MLGTVVLACGTAFAQNPPAADRPQAADDATSSIFQQLDTNQDGRISSEEAQASAVVSRSFGKADTNGDGAITRDEFMTSFTTRAPGATPPAVPPPARQ